MRIYTDESCTQADQGSHMLIGGIICDKETSKEMRKAVQRLLDNYQGLIPNNFEFHFSHMKPDQVNIYMKLCDIFFDFFQEKCLYKRGLKQSRTYRRACFEAMVIEHAKIDHNRFSGGDRELGFFQFYYTLLAHTIKKHYIPDNQFHITIDAISTKNPQMLPNLHRRLNSCCLPEIEPPICNINKQNSKAELMLQMTDVILGCISFTWNKKLVTSNPRNDAKRTVSQYVESKLGKPLTQPSYYAESFNIWEIELS